MSRKHKTYNLQQNTTEPFRVYWKVIHTFSDSMQVILYRIEDTILYKINIHSRIILVLANAANVIPDVAEPISREEYESYLLKYLV